MFFWNHACLLPPTPHLPSPQLCTAPLKQTLFPICTLLCSPPLSLSTTAPSASHCQWYCHSRPSPLLHPWQFSCQQTFQPWQKTCHDVRHGPIVFLLISALSSSPPSSHNYMPDLVWDWGGELLRVPTDLIFQQSAQWGEGNWYCNRW